MLLGAPVVPCCPVGRCTCTLRHAGKRGQQRAFWALLAIFRSGGIDFDEFVHIIERQKAAAAARDDKADMLEAFVALGGKVTGHHNQRAGFTMLLAVQHRVYGQ